jgi:iron complex transport system substrate-binding protein
VFFCFFSVHVVAAQSGVVARDDAGRTRQLAAPAERVLAAGGPAEVLLITLAPQHLVAVNREPSSAARRFLREDLMPSARIRQLPESGNASRDGDALALKPDLILDYGSLHQDYIARADAIEARLHVPYVLFDGSLARIPDAYRRIGPLVGAEARGNELAALAQRLLDKTRGLFAQAPARRVYITDSADGLSPVFTDFGASEIFAWLGLQNVAGALDDAKTLPIDFAQVEQWRPDAIFALDPALRERAAADARWQRLDAVRARRIHVAPRLPFDWMARPPSVNRLLGLVWVAMVLSPPDQRAGLERDLRELLTTLLQRQLTADELQELLAST